MPRSEAPGIVHTATPWKAAISALVGSAMEFYDFCIFGTASALVFGKIFFPHLDASTSLFLTFGTLGLGYLARPIGALFLGHMGDKYGRKRVLVLTLSVMGVSTFLIGCLPGYEHAGWIAPTLLLVLRVLQGMAASGEQAAANGMSLEHAPQHRRAFFASFTANGSHAGSVLATAVFAPILFLPDAHLLTWGWRVPFWLGSVVLFLGYLVRRNVHETPIFEAAKRDAKIVHLPIARLFHCYPGDVLRVVCSSLMATVGVIVTVYGLSYAVNVAKISRETMVLSTFLSCLLGIFAIPLWSTLADRIGRKPVCLIGMIMSPTLTFPYFWAMDAHNIPLVFTFGILSLGVAYSAFNGVWGAFFGEMFDGSVRLSGTGIGTQLGFGLSGATPALAVACTANGAETWVPGACIAAGASAIAVIAALTARETYKMDIHACGRAL